MIRNNGGKGVSNSRVNMFSNSLKLHTKTHTAVRSRPTLKDVERFRNGSNLMRDHELYERSIYERTILSEPSIENYAISNELSIELSNKSVKPIHEHRQVSRRDQEPSRIPLQTVERLKNKSREITDVLVHVYPNRLNFIGV